MPERPTPDQKGPILTPLHQIPNNLFKRGDIFAGLREREHEPPLDPPVIEMAKLAVGIYQTMHQERDQQRARVADTIALVDDISLSPILPGRWSVSFSTTHHEGPDDRRVWGSTFMFDVQSDEINQTYPAREKNWVVGTQQEERSVIGKYKELCEQATRLPARLRRIAGLGEWLESQGWRDVGEIWLADFDRFAGALPTAENA